MPRGSPRPLRAEVGFVHLAVVADVLDDAIGPVVVDAEQLAEVAFQAEEAPRLRVLGRLLHLIDIGLGDAEYLAFEHGVVHPLHQPRPSLVALAGERAERLQPADRLGQEDPVVRLLHGGARRGDRSAVVGVAVAASGIGGGERLLRLVEQQRVDLDVVGPVVVGDVGLQRGAGQQADRGAVQVLGVRDAEALAHHEGLARCRS